MKENDAVLWGIHGGRAGDADTLFLKKHVVAVGWARVGDLGKRKVDREVFKKAVAAAYPDKKPGAIPNNAGQLFRFMHEMNSATWWFIRPSATARCTSGAWKALTAMIPSWSRAIPIYGR